MAHGVHKDDTFPVGMDGAVFVFSFERYPNIDTFNWHIEISYNFDPQETSMHLQTISSFNVIPRSVTKWVTANSFWMPCFPPVYECFGGPLFRVDRILTTV